MRITDIQTGLEYTKISIPNIFPPELYHRRGDCIRLCVTGKSLVRRFQAGSDIRQIMQCHFPLQGILFGIVLIAFMIPGQITYISVYLMMSKAKLINSLWPQILPLGANAFGIFMLRQGFKQIPDEIIESARLDNASEAQIMTRICLPMCKSSMITIAMFSFIGTWNAYFWPLVMTNSDKFRPLTLYIEKLKQEVEQGIMWNEIMAGNFILVVPVIIVFIFASKKIIQAFAYNGMK